MKKIIIILFITINSLFANNFKVISRQGEASVIVNKEHSDIDIKKSFPNDYFSISTKESSYMVIDNGEKSIILMPQSKLTFQDNQFTLPCFIGILSLSIATSVPTLSLPCGTIKNTLGPFFG